MYVTLPGLPTYIAQTSYMVGCLADIGDFDSIESEGETFGTVGEIGFCLFFSWSSFLAWSSRAGGYSLTTRVGKAICLFVMCILSILGSILEKSTTNHFSKEKRKRYYWRPHFMAIIITAWPR